MKDVRLFSVSQQEGNLKLSMHKNDKNCIHFRDGFASLWGIYLALIVSQWSVTKKKKKQLMKIWNSIYPDRTKMKKSKAVFLLTRHHFDFYVRCKCNSESGHYTAYAQHDLCPPTYPILSEFVMHFWNAKQCSIKK